MIKTNKEVKIMCVNKLKELISEIESNKTSDNYSFNWDLLEQFNTPDMLVRNVRFSVNRTDYKALGNGG